MGSEKLERRSHMSMARWVALVIMLAATTWQFIGAWTDSQTTDEAVHLSAGYSYWRTNDHRLNPEHPVLFKLWASWPLLFLSDIKFSTTDPDWIDPNQWIIGSNLVYGSLDSAWASRWIMLIGRAPMIAIWAGLGGLLFWWAKRKWNEWAAVLTVGVYAFDPSWLGHGHLITNDLAMSLALVGMMVVLEKFISQPSWKNLTWLTLLFIAAQLTKFSALFLWAAVPLVVIAQIFSRPRVMTGRWLVRMLVIFAVATPIAIWAAYGFEVQRFDSEPRLAKAITQASLITNPADLTYQSVLTQFVYKHADPATWTGKIFTRVRHWPIPAYHFFVGLIDTFDHNYFGHTAFLLGQVRDQGWWYYFPVAIAVKLPLVTWAAIVATATWWLVRRRRPGRWLAWPWPISFWTMGVVPVIYLVWSMSGHINIGVRHVFPFMIFIPLWIGSLLSHQWFNPTRAKWTAISVTAALALTSLLAWPHTIGYFNALAGGTRNGHNVLQDSNLDWNQDTWRLVTYVRKNQLNDYGLAIPGGRQTMFFPGTGTVPVDREIAAGQRPTGTYFINAMVLFDPNGEYKWLTRSNPTAIIGTGIYRFDFR